MWFLLSVDGEFTITGLCSMGKKQISDFFHSHFHLLQLSSEFFMFVVEFIL
ncbi:hypothetical protein Lalb_Chr25g0282221 [Lupinus albus]|uniref:Uncharacterized protein n=1 Tax=Lupinus albus TaxID=3870 RepID=A0A6A4N798_LUPAL|nr:hypothetical protein Lalb_Chr25g0282221 [Lupinus albus]